MNEETTKTPRLFLIDAMPLLYRGHFVFLRNPMMTSGGKNVSALFGFAATLTQILQKEQPTHVAVVFDSPKPTFRHEMYPEYKAQREKAPEDLRDAIPMAIRLAEVLKLKVLRIDGVEADDVLGTLSTMADREEMDAVVVTPDKDAAQLVSKRVSLMRPGKGNAPAELLGEKEVCEKWALESVDQMVDLLGMMGDASDNIPGIPGVGEKTAIKLLKQFGSMENLLANTDQLKGKQREKVEANVDQARLSRELVAIRRDVPLDLSLADLKPGDWNTEEVKAVLDEYELNTISRRLLGETSTEADATSELKSAADTAHDYRLVNETQALQELVDTLAQAERFAFDTETTGVDPRSARLVGISFAIKPHEAFYVPVPAEADAREALLDLLRPALCSPTNIKIGHNLKYDLEVMHRHGVEVSSPVYDTMLAHYVLDPGDRHGMDHLARQLLGYEPIPITELIGRGDEQLTMAEVAVEDVCEYAAEDADVTLQLYEKLSEMVKEAGAVAAVEECENPLVKVLLDMEREGVRVDVTSLKHASAALGQEIMALEREIHDLANGSFNVASPKQLGEVLFERLAIVAKPKKTKSGQYATNEQVLSGLVDKHPIVGKVLEHRACAKLKNTYLDKLPTVVDAETGRIHTSFRQAVTETGRLASQDPNLQNIPIRTERGRRIREAFVARDSEHVLVSADYSQIELRIMASLSGDKGMIEAFKRGEDIHAATAARVHGVMEGLVTREMRSQAKMVNFGVIYGISAFGLSQRLHIPRKRAAGLIDAYFEQYPGVKTYMEKTIAFAREHGYVTTMLGRRRLIRDIDSRNGTVRQGAERNAINTPIQGSAADMIKLAMVRVHDALKAAGCRSKMVLQIHDELLLDVYRPELETVKPLVEVNMREAMTLDVPVVVDVGVGENWLEAH